MHQLFCVRCTQRPTPTALKSFTKPTIESVNGLYLIMVASVVDSFSGQTLKQEQLLSKKYNFLSWALINLVSKEDKTFKARIAQNNDGSIAGSTSLEMPYKRRVLKYKLRASGAGRLAVEYTKRSLKLKGEVNAQPASEKWDGSVSAEYTKPHNRAKVALTYPLAAQLTATGEQGHWIWGLDLKYDQAAQRLTTYDFLGSWNKRLFKFVFKHVSVDKTKYAFGDWVYSYYQSAGRMKLGSSIIVNWPTKETFLEFGGVYKQADDLKFRAKVNSKGILAAGLTKTCSANLNLSVAIQVDAKKAAKAGVSDYQLGVRLDFVV